MKILALDFDGVIADTGFEVFCVAASTYRKFFDTELVDREFVFEAYDYYKSKKELLKKFNNLRAYSSTADEQVIIFYIIDNNIEIRTNEDFNKVAAQFEDRKKEFFETFYELRKLMQVDMEKWVSLGECFPEILNDLGKIDVKQIILTNKDMAAVLPLCKRFGFKIDKEDVFDVRLSKDKNKKLEIIKDKYGVEYSDIIFIDDVSRNLIPAIPLGVKVMLATWFHGNKDQIELAEKENIPILTIENFREKVEAELE